MLDFPPPVELPNTSDVVPYVVLGDEAFPLLPNLLKPYPRDQSLNDRTKAIFNYRLSRARRIVENAFGILTQLFRIFNTPIYLNVDTIEDVVTSACILHNIMIDEKMTDGRNYDHVDEAVTSDLDSFNVPDNEVHSSQATEIRDMFRNYFNSDLGSVSWQNETFRL